MRIHPSNNAIRETNSASPNPCGAIRPRISCGLAAISIAVAAALAASVPTFAATTSTATWTDAGGDNNWANPANWSYTVVPNPLTSPGNGGGGIDNYNVIIGLPSPTNLSGTGTIGLASLTINSGGVLNTSSTGLDTGEFFNSGTVNVTGSLQLQAAALQGSGTIALVSGTTPAALTLQLPFIGSISPTTSITSSNTITGAGTLSVSVLGFGSFTNDGTIAANVASATLSLQFQDTLGISNQGTLEATNGGTLNLEADIGNPNISQTATGLIYAHGGEILLSGVDGGTISTDDGGTVSAVALGGSADNPLVISSASAVNVNSTAIYQYSLSGNITNNGTINLGGAAGKDSQLDLNGNTTIGGIGSVVLAGGTLDLEQVPSTSSSYNLTLGPSQTLSGAGTLEMFNSGIALTNNGTVNANVAGGTLAVVAPYSYDPITNNGTMAATNGGTLDVENVAQSVTGVIDAASGNMQIESVSGGTLESAAGYAINLVSTPSGLLPGNEISGTTANPLTITSGSTVVVAPPTGSLPDSVGVAGAVVNDGTIQVQGPPPSNGGFQSVALSLTANTNISGSGTIVLSNNGGIDSTGDSGQQVYTLTVGPQQTISGDGYLGSGDVPNLNTLNVVNNGTIDANSAGGRLSVGGTSNTGIEIATATNNGVLEATNGGTLYLSSTVINQSNSGVIYADGGTVSIASAFSDLSSAGPVISGGTLQSDPGSEIQSGDSFVLNGSASTPTTITTGTIVDAPVTVSSFPSGFPTAYPTAIQISGTVTNNGLIRVGDNPSGIFPASYQQFLIPELILRPNSTLSGTGSVIIAPSPYQIYNQQHPTSAPIPPSQLHESELAINATEFGPGTSVVDNQLTNGGIVLADGTGASLELQAENTNNGTYEAESGGVLQVDSGTLANYSSSTLTGGAYDAASGGSINLVGASITTNAANVTLDGASSTFAAIAPITQNTGSFTLTNSAAFTTAGDFTNTGTVAVLNGAGFVVAGKLTNSGTITLDPSTMNINGDMILQSTSTLSFGLSGNTSGQYDQINVSGTATLAGALSVNIQPGFTPTLGEMFTILTAGNGITGVFNQSTVTSGLDLFQVQYSNGSVQLDTTAVPEPATLVLLAAVGAGLMLLRRPRREGRGPIRARVQFLS